MLKKILLVAGLAALLGALLYSHLSAATNPAGSPRVTVSGGR